MRGLTNKQSKFLEAYKQLNDGPKSAISAGYSAKSAQVEACRLLKHPAILLDLDNWRKERGKTITREDFIGLAIKDYEALDVKEPNKPRFLDLAGKTLGYINNNGDSRPNQTLNITISSDQLNNNQTNIWENTRKLLGM